MVSKSSSPVQECISCKRRAKKYFHDIPFCGNCFNKFRLFKMNEENTPKDEYLRSLMLPSGKRHVDALNLYSTIFDPVAAMDCVDTFLGIIGKEDDKYIQMMPLLFAARSVVLFGRKTTGYHEPTNAMTNMLYRFGGLVCMQMCVRISESLDDIDIDDDESMEGIIKEMDSITFKVLEDIRANNVETLTTMVDEIEEIIRGGKTNDEERRRSMQKTLQVIDRIFSEEVGE